MRKAIIFGSARSDGQTRKTIEELSKLGDFDIIDLNDYKIGYYDYNNINIDDDYLPLLRKLTANYDTFVFATPVYWYAMTAQMKVFFDRLSDLLDVDKETGRKLRGMKTAAITTSMGNNIGDAFWLPFIGTSDYLGMHFLGGLHTVNNVDATAEIKEFAEMINRA